MNYITILITVVRAVAALLPELANLANAVASAIPAGGGARLEFIKAILEAAYADLEAVDIGFDKVWPTIQAVVTKLLPAEPASAPATATGAAA